MIFPKDMFVVTTRDKITIYDKKDSTIWFTFKRPEFTIKEHGFRCWFASWIADLKWRNKFPITRNYRRKEDGEDEERGVLGNNI